MSADANRVAVVTGGGRGIGAAIAAALADAGFDVAILSRESESDAADAIAGARRSSGKLVYLQHDVARIDEHRAAIDRVRRELGEIDCLVNNAGVTSLARGDLLELTPESFDRTVAVNLRGTFFLTQAVARTMLDRTPAAATYRSIVNITSANAEIVGADRADYCVTKAALSMMSKLFAARLAAAGVHVFEVRPGIIRTEMTAPAAAKYDALIAQGAVPLGRWGMPDDVGRAVGALAEGRLPFATGEVINVGGGLHLHRV
ncbi:MAG TPA: 3-ketoacyl-ACP reductase [Casimicrobiaceae bacterium]|nr:3-ketoacyl-ACP reductase [Casimicrobiaceae bacterium]